MPKFFVKPYFKFTKLTPMQMMMVKVQSSGFQQKFTTLYLRLMDINNSNSIVFDTDAIFDADDVGDFMAEYMIMGWGGFTEKYDKEITACCESDPTFKRSWQNLRCAYSDAALRDPTNFLRKLKIRLQKDLADLDNILTSEPAAPEDPR